MRTCSIPFFCSPQKQIEIGVVGGGSSAVSFVAQLVRRVKGQLPSFDSQLRRIDSAKAISDLSPPQSSNIQITVHIFEQNETVGPGLAYGQSITHTRPSHLINLYASTMSSLPDCPTDFVDWIKSTQRPEVSEASLQASSDPWAVYRAEFPPRALFGEYLKFVLDRAKRESELVNTSAKLSVNIVSHPCTLAYALESTKDANNTTKISVKTSLGTYLQDFICDLVVIATGHISLPPSCLSDHFIHASSKYIDSPWPIRSRHPLCFRYSFI